MSSAILVPNGYAYWQFENSGSDTFNGASNYIESGSFTINSKVGTYAINSTTNVANNLSIFADNVASINTVKTWSFWMNMDGAIADGSNIFFSDGGSISDLLGLWRDGSANLEVRYYINGVTKSWNFDVPGFGGGTGIDTWYMFTFVQEGSLLQLYKNDIIVSNLSTSTFLDSGYDKFSLGGGITGFGTNSIILDNMVLDVDAWTSDDVVTAYNSGSGDTFSKAVVSIVIDEIFLVSTTPDQKLYPDEGFGNTTDQTPTFNISTDIAGTCNISVDNSSWTACSTSEDVGHVCTQGTPLDYGDNVEYMRCNNSLTTFAWAEVNISIKSIPNITSSAPANNTMEWGFVGPFLFNFTVIDYDNASGLVCNLSFNDSTFNQFNTNVLNNTLTGWSIALTTADYIWNLTCSDSVYNDTVGDTNFFLNFSGPNITYVLPVNDTKVFDVFSPYNFNFSVVDMDNSTFNCTLDFNNSLYNYTQGVVNDTITIIWANLSSSDYLWNLSCTDGLLNDTKGDYFLRIGAASVNNVTCSGIKNGIEFYPNMDLYNWTTGFLTDYNVSAENTSLCGYTYSITPDISTQVQVKLNVSLNHSFVTKFNMIEINNNWTTIINGSSGVVSLVNVTGDYVNASGDSPPFNVSWRFIE